MTRLPADFPDRLRDLFSTVDVARMLMRPERDDTRLERIVHLAADLAGAESGILLVVDEDRGDLVVAAATGPGAEALVDTHIASSADVAGSAMATGEPVAVAAGEGSSLGGEIERRSRVPARNVLAVPFEVHGTPSGALELRNTEAAHGFDPTTIARVSELARIAAAAIEDFRGDRFLFSLFAAALPRALAPGDDPSRAALADEIRRWVESIRQTPAYRGAVDAVQSIRDLMDGGEEAVRMAADILATVARRERARRERSRGRT